LDLAQRGCGSGSRRDVADFGEDVAEVSVSIGTERIVESREVRGSFE
jgi:hypothetical protein